MKLITSLLSVAIIFLIIAIFIISWNLLNDTSAPAKQNVNAQDNGRVYTDRPNKTEKGLAELARDQFWIEQEFEAAINQAYDNIANLDTNTPNYLANDAVHKLELANMLALTEPYEALSIYADIYNEREYYSEYRIRALMRASQYLANQMSFDVSESLLITTLINTYFSDDLFGPAVKDITGSDVIVGDINSINNKLSQVFEHISQSTFSDRIGTLAQTYVVMYKTKSSPDDLSGEIATLARKVKNMSDNTVTYPEFEEDFLQSFFNLYEATKKQQAAGHSDPQQLQSLKEWSSNYTDEYPEEEFITNSFTFN